MAETRNTPILVVVSDGETKRLTQAIEMGVNDYLMRPVDKNEMLARVRTQLRKKRYADKLRYNIQLSREMAVTDQLTGLHNRGYMARNLDTLMKNANPQKPISFLIMDIDYFKSVNDTHGHDIGDEVLREFATRVAANVRAAVDHEAVQPALAGEPFRKNGAGVAAAGDEDVARMSHALRGQEPAGAQK